MRRSSSTPDRGSALIEAVVIGSFVFIVVAAAVSATVEVAVAGGTAVEAARVLGVHAARHEGPEAAERLAGSKSLDLDATSSGGVIHVVVTDRVGLPHPGGLRSVDVIGVTDVPMAPYRSDRG
jgi:hypothetical protein